MEKKKILPMRDFYELFRISLIIKATDGMLETLAGVFFYLVKYSTINAVIFSIFHGEIAENPRDLFWGVLIKEWHTFSLRTQSFWGLLFVAHGITKVVLAILLLKKYLWAYPLSIVIFSLFIIYEVYALIQQPSIFLGLITVFDAIVIGLIVHEYQRAKRVLA
jgi:uncharacterized membrane protein